MYNGVPRSTPLIVAPLAVLGAAHQRRRLDARHRADAIDRLGQGSKANSLVGAPLPPATFGVHGERFHAQGGGAAAGLGEHRVKVVTALREQAPGCQSNTDEDHRDGKLVGDVLEMVADRDPRTIAPLQKIKNADRQ